MIRASPDAGLFEPARDTLDLRWRGRPCWASIDLDAIETNCRTMSALIPPGVGLMAVVKANAYGHGIVGVAEAMVIGGATSFGVACVDEAAQLRSAGIDSPIVVLGYVPHWEAERALRLDLTLALASRQLALALASAAHDLGRPATVHVKIDSGMGRYGLLPNEALEFLRFCDATPGLRIEGIFTHLATADEPDQSHAIEQLDVFDDVCRLLAAHDMAPPIKHAANSAAMLAFPRSHHNVVRSGICLYGVAPAAMPGVPALRPALSLKARVARLRTLPAGSCVGYGCTYRTPRDTAIALLPVGYADGVSRSLSNRAEVLVAGRRAPIVGRISMDQCTVDVTDLMPIRQDDEAVVIGRDGADEIGVDEIANWRGTIGYEVLTGLSTRVPRVYMRGGDPIAVAENGEYRKFVAGGY